MQVSQTTNPGRHALTDRPYQRDAIAAVHQLAADGCRRALLIMPTGAGKTFTFCRIIEERGGRALILAHREELIAQAVEMVRLVLVGRSVGIVQASQDEPGADIVVASVATLAQPGRLARLVSSGPFATVVVDEAHHATAPTYRRIIEATGAGTADGPLLLGVTATPDRGDGLGLDGVFDAVAADIGMVDLIEAGYLSDIRAVRVAFRADASQLQTRAGEITESSAAKWFRDGGGPAAVAAAIATHAADRRSILAFCPDVATSHQTAATLAAHGIEAAAIDGGMPAADRRAIVDRYRAGDLRAVVNCAILTEGFDAPATDCVILARPTKSRALYAQCVGRGTRRHPAKRDLLLLDLAGATGRHDLASAASLAGLAPGDLEDGGSIGEAVARQRDRAALASARLAQAQMVDVALTSRAVDVFRNSRARWVAAATGERYILPAGPRQIVLMPDVAGGDRWAAFLSGGGGAAAEWIIEGAGLELATGAAEDFARSIGAGALIAADAPWRGSKPTERQLTYAAALRIDVPDGATRGDVADLITAAKGAA